MNEVLKAIKNRRTVRRFKPNPIDEEMLQMILEAGRWAPSFSNLQPWRFIVIKDQGLKNALDKAARESVLHLGINEAPVVILVCVDRRIDPLHAIEAGAAATQNMTLAAYSLGLGAGWIGIWGGEQRLKLLSKKFLNSLRQLERFLCFPSAFRMSLQKATGSPSKS
ncbi:MAG: nitroreductase family protein [Thermodesulfobacteriota bacterium]